MQSKVVKVHGLTQMFAMVDHVRKMTPKNSCKYGGYRSLEHKFALLAKSLV